MLVGLLAHHEVNFIWHVDLLDVPVHGVCLYGNRWCWYRAKEIRASDGGRSKVYMVFSLSKLEQWQCYVAKKMFEWCVGRHCSYPFRRVERIKKKSSIICLFLHRFYYSPFNVSRRLVNKMVSRYESKELPFLLEGVYSE